MACVFDRNDDKSIFFPGYDRDSSAWASILRRYLKDLTVSGEHGDCPASTRGDYLQFYRKGLNPLRLSWAI
jgi:hypothetical protein